MIELVACIAGTAAAIGTMIAIYDRRGGVGTLGFLGSLAFGLSVFATGIYMGHQVFA